MSLDVKRIPVIGYTQQKRTKPWRKLQGFFRAKNQAALKRGLMRERTGLPQSAKLRHGPGILRCAQYL